MTQLFLDFQDHPPDGSPPEPPPPRETPPESVLVRELIRIVGEGRPGRSVLIGRTRGEGKELLRQVALRGVSWVGVEATTLRPLAFQLASRRLAAETRRMIDPFDEQALVERAIDDVLSSDTPGRFHGLIDKVGFRDAVRNSVVALRLGGIHVGRLVVASIDDSEKQKLVTAILDRYELLLEEGGQIDTAGVIELATEVVSEEGLGAMAGTRLFLLPGAPAQGVVGRFARALEGRGARILRTDPVEGMPVPRGVLVDVAPPESPFSYLHAVERLTGEPPEIDIFAAASVYDELRGVLRRILARGARWDEVEIVTPDPAGYGSALHALTAPLGVPVTYAVGLPVERTRPGRVVAEYFRWLESGFQESVLRGLIEAGDIQPPDPHEWIDGPRLARSLRSLRIGWGRERYTRAIQGGLQSLEHWTPGRYEDEEQLEKRRRRTRRDLEALDALIGPLLRATPPVPAGAEAARDTTAAEVAAGVLAVLDVVAPGTDTDETAAARLRRILERIRATLTRRTDFSAAVAIVRGYLEIRIPAPRAEGTAPWSSAPGHLYLTDLVSGGASGRPHVFIVGLDSGRFPGHVAEDPLLLDSERWRLGRDALPQTKDRLHELKFGLAQLIARCRGSLTLSYPLWEPADGRSLTPAPEVLQAFRLREGDPHLTFAHLEEALGDAESRLPGPEGRLDRDDVWLGLLATGDGRLLRGLRAVRREYPGLAAGMRALDAWSDPAPSVYAGILGPMDPPASYQSPYDAPYSASRLSDLGACPRRFLFRSVIRAYPPDDPDFDPERWLDARQRGTLLHDVFEEALQWARDEGVEYEDPAFLEAVLTMVDRRAARALLEIPTPSRAVHEWEVEDLRDDARSFVAMVRAERPVWTHLELRFGFDGPEVLLPVGDRSLKVRGAIDRIDERGKHLRVVDYKTGGFFGFDNKSGVYHGGRRLQHLIYSAAAAQLTGRDVGRVEYHFPTRRGEHRVRAYETSELKRGGRLVARMLAGVEAGWFPPTDDPEDCKFCDYQEICGVAVGRWGIDSRPAGWAAEHLAHVAELGVLREVRRWEDEQPVFEDDAS